MNSIPLVTVIVPSYNHRNYLEQCLDSIKNQTFHDFQWIVVDDGSSDGSQGFLKERQSFYGYELILQKNKGVSVTLTETLSLHAKGKYLAACASDDAWLPNKLEIQVDYMESHPNCAMCFGRTYKIDVNSNIIGDDSYKSHLYKGGSIFDDIITQKFHPPVNYMQRIDVLKSLGYYPKGIIAEDFYMNCKIALNYEIGYIPEFLGYYREAPLVSKRDPYSLVKSHEDTIMLYKSQPIFNRAIKLSNLRTFLKISPYKKYKLLSLKYMMGSLSLIRDKRFLKALSFWFGKWYTL